MICVELDEFLHDAVASPAGPVLINVQGCNGLPFASPNGLYNLSKLSVWWLRLGIGLERIKPGHPQQNGRHERMHLTLKKEATRPPGLNSLQQQARFDDFVSEFNTERLTKP
jgi:transposase InsO family protein